MSKPSRKRASKIPGRQSRRPSHIALRRSAFVFHDGYAFQLAQDLRHQGYEVTEQPLLAAPRASHSHLAVVAARPDRVRPQRLCILLRELLGHGTPVLAVGAGLPAVVRLFGGRVEPNLGGTARLADVHTEGELLFAGLPSQLRLPIPNGSALHRSAVSKELRITASARDGEVIGVSHIFRPVHAVHTAVLENDDLRPRILANAVRSPS